MVKTPLVLCIVAGMTTGMGNGSVFGAALMLFLGREYFPDWGGIGWYAWTPVTYVGLFYWIMIIFGVAFASIMYIAIRRHNELEAENN